MKYHRRPWAEGMARLAAVAEPGRYPDGVRGTFRMGPFSVEVIATWHDARGMWLLQPGTDDFRTPEALRQQGWKLVGPPTPPSPHTSATTRTIPTGA